MLNHPTLIRSAFAAAGLMLATSAPATATERAAANGTTTTRSSADEAHKKICLSLDITGSRIPKHECLTKDQWIDMGVTFRSK